WAGQLDVSQPFTAHSRQRHFDAALIANYAAVFHALVLAAQALPIGDRPEDARAEQSIALGLKSPVINRFRFSNLAVRPAPDLLGRSQADPDGIEVGDQICSIVRRR